MDGQNPVNPFEPPQNVEAEESVLGAMMIAGKAIERVAPLVEAAMFYRESHGRIYAAALDLYRAGVPVDVITLTDALERRGELEGVGGRPRVAELAALVPAASNAGHYAEIVREAWKRREVIAGLSAALSTAWEGTADEALLTVEAAALQLRSKVERGRSNVVRAIEAAEWFEAKLKNPPSEEDGVKGPFGFLPWWRPGRLYVLGGYTADGKTALAMQALRVAGAAYHRVGYITIEMSWGDLVDRLVTTYGVPYRQAQSGHVMSAFRGAAERAIKELAVMNVDLIDDESADAAAIWRYQRLGRYDMLVIDHLHRIDWEERRDLEREVKAITTVARRENIPVLLLAQLRRPDREFARPSLSSFRDSAVIEQEASLAACVYRPRDQDGNPGEDAEFIVLKNRYGRTGSYPLTFKMREVRFEERIAP